MGLSEMIYNVARNECSDFILDTTKIGNHYETAIKHRYFNNREWIILERYDDEEEAKGSHEFYLNTFSKYDINKIADIDDEIYMRQEV